MHQGLHRPWRATGVVLSSVRRGRRRACRLHRQGRGRRAGRGARCAGGGIGQGQVVEQLAVGAAGVFGQEVGQGVGSRFTRRTFLD